MKGHKSTTILNFKLWFELGFELWFELIAYQAIALVIYSGGLD